MRQISRKMSEQGWRRVRRSTFSCISRCFNLRCSPCCSKYRDWRGIQHDWCLRNEKILFINEKQLHFWKLRLNKWMEPGRSYFWRAISSQRVLWCYPESTWQSLDPLERRNRHEGSILFARCLRYLEHNWRKLIIYERHGRFHSVLPDLRRRYFMSSIWRSSWWLYLLWACSITYSLGVS